MKYANIIAHALFELAPYEKADTGPILDELTFGLTAEFDGRDPESIPDEEYEPKKAQIVRSINLLKKTHLKH